MRTSHHTIKAGTTSTSLLVYARAEQGRGVAGLHHDVAGATAAYVRAGEGRAHPVDLRPGTVGTHIEGGFVEVDPELLPGVYQFGAPDAMLAPGSTRAVLVLRFPGAVLDPVEVSLVAYDPQDGWRIGIEGLADERRHEFLRRALPRLTEMELSLGDRGEQQLRSRQRPEVPE